MANAVNGMKNNLDLYNWLPDNILDSNLKNINYGLIILNQPININKDFMLPLWKNALFRNTVDGGTNRWFTWVSENNISSNDVNIIPDLVSGDMDSVTIKNKQRLMTEPNPPLFIETMNQNETDYTKALREIKSYVVKNDITIDAVIALIETSGRIDQILANINTLYNATKILPGIPVFQLASDSLSWLLPPGFHCVEIPKVLRDNNAWCSLMPVGEKCTNIFTTGLKWNLENKSLEFGGLTSSSNTYSGENVVTIKTSNHVLWSMGLEVLNFTIESS